MPEVPVKLSVPQARLLAALASAPAGGLPREACCLRAGLSPTSGTFPSAVTGVREGSTHGPPSPGLLRMGLVRAVRVDVDGLQEVAYAVTQAGRDALAAWLSRNRLPAVKERAAATNKRYA